MVDVGELRKFELFGTFSDKQLEEVAKITEKKSYKAGTHVYEHGDVARYLFIVTKGVVNLREIKPDDQLGVAFETRERGEFFGAACFMEPRQYTLTGVCTEDCEVLAMDADKILSLCEGNPEMGYKLMKKIARLYFERYKIAKRQLHQMVREPQVITALPG
jgi:CRP-like cAMP-binding protein